jgi:hypothetical protein
MRAPATPGRASGAGGARTALPLSGLARLPLADGALPGNDRPAGGLERLRRCKERPQDLRGSCLRRSGGCLAGGGVSSSHRPGRDRFSGDHHARVVAGPDVPARPGIEPGIRAQGEAGRAPEVFAGSASRCIGPKARDACGPGRGLPATPAEARNRRLTAALAQGGGPTRTLHTASRPPGGDQLRRHRGDHAAPRLRDPFKQSVCPCHRCRATVRERARAGGEDVRGVACRSRPSTDPVRTWRSCPDPWIHAARSRWARFVLPHSPAR